MIVDKIKKMNSNDLLHLFKIITSYLPGKILKLYQSDIWIISERENDARDNGYWLFKYVREKYPNKNVFYAINFSSKDYEKVEKLGNVIEFGSYKHHLYTWACTKFISAHIGNGFPSGRICFNLLMWNFYSFKNVFLQHGITHNAPSYLLSQNNKIELFCCAAKREYEFVRNNLGYSQKNTCILGFCRYDNLKNIKKQKKQKKQVLIMPTWRKWLVNEFENPYELKQKFIDSNYYKQFIGLIKDENLKTYLQNKDIIIYFYLHPDLQQYFDLFTEMNQNVIVCTEEKYDIQTLLRSSECLITDYSSIAFDFAYMKKPILYFQFDYQEYRDNHYSEGYFNYEKDGFGLVLKTRKEIVSELIYICNEDFRNRKIYLKRCTDFFYFNDQKNCKRTFEKIAYF